MNSMPPLESDKHVERVISSVPPQEMEIPLGEESVVVSELAGPIFQHIAENIQYRGQMEVIPPLLSVRAKEWGKVADELAVFSLSEKEQEEKYAVPHIPYETYETPPSPAKELPELRAQKALPSLHLEEEVLPAPEHPFEFMRPLVKEYEKTVKAKVKAGIMPAEDSIIVPDALTEPFILNSLFKQHLLSRREELQTRITTDKSQCKWHQFDLTRERFPPLFPSEQKELREKIALLKTRIANYKEKQNEIAEALATIEIVRQRWIPEDRAVEDRKVAHERHPAVVPPAFISGIQASAAGDRKVAVSLGMPGRARSQSVFLEDPTIAALGLISNDSPWVKDHFKSSTAFMDFVEFVYHWNSAKNDVQRMLKINPESDRAAFDKEVSEFEKNVNPMKAGYLPKKDPLITELTNLNEQLRAGRSEFYKAFETLRTKIEQHIQTEEAQKSKAEMDIKMAAEEIWRVNQQFLIRVKNTLSEEGLKLSLIKQALFNLIELSEDGDDLWIKEREQAEAIGTIRTEIGTIRTELETANNKYKDLVKKEKVAQERVNNLRENLKSKIKESRTTKEDVQVAEKELAEVMSEKEEHVQARKIKREEYLKALETVMPSREIDTLLGIYLSQALALFEQGEIEHCDLNSRLKKDFSDAIRLSLIGQAHTAISDFKQWTIPSRIQRRLRFEAVLKDPSALANVVTDLNAAYQTRLKRDPMWEDGALKIVSVAMSPLEKRELELKPLEKELELEMQPLQLKVQELNKGVQALKEEHKLNKEALEAVQIELKWLAEAQPLEEEPALRMQVLEKQELELKEKVQSLEKELALKMQPLQLQVQELEKEIQVLKEKHELKKEVKELREVQKSLTWLNAVQETISLVRDESEKLNKKVAASGINTVKDEPVFRLVELDKNIAVLLAFRKNEQKGSMLADTAGIVENQLKAMASGEEFHKEQIETIREFCENCRSFLRDLTPQTQANLTLLDETYVNPMPPLSAPLILYRETHVASIQAIQHVVQGFELLELQKEMSKLNLDDRIKQLKQDKDPVTFKNLNREFQPLREQLRKFKEDKTFYEKYKESIDKYEKQYKQYGEDLESLSKEISSGQKKRKGGRLSV